MTENRKRIVNTAYDKAMRKSKDSKIKQAEMKVEDAQRRIDNIIILADENGVNSKGVMKEEAKVALGELESAKMALRGLRE